MRRRTATLAVVVMLAGLPVGPFLPRTALAETFATEVVSILPPDAHDHPFGTSPQRPQLSTDNRYVVWLTSFLREPGNVATLVPEQIMWRALATGTTTVVSTNPTTGAYGDSHSGQPWISEDGRYVTFRSHAGNLLAGVVTPAIYQRDMVTGTLELVMEDSYENVSVSADGRYVAFDAWNALIPEDVNSRTDVYVRDMVTGTFELVSVNSDGEQGDGHAEMPFISGDGAVVAFMSDSTNIVPGDTGGFRHVYVRDLDEQTTELASTSTTGGFPDNQSFSASVSWDGRHVAFQSVAGNIVPGDTNGAHDIFVRDRATASTTRASMGPSGEQVAPAGWASGPNLSAGGRFVAFLTDHSSGIVPGKTTTHPEPVVKDRVSGRIRRAAVADGTGAEANASSLSGTFSPDASRLVFASGATNLVEPDPNEFDDVFVHHLTWSDYVSRPPAELFGRRRSGGYANDPVNTATGNFTTEENDLDFPAGVFGLDWTRTYNSRDDGGSALGPGWVHAAASSLVEEAGGDVVLTDRDGRVVRFDVTASGYTSPEELFGTLTKKPDGTFGIAYFDGTEEAFSATGRLTARRSWDGQEVAYAYDGAGKLTGVASSTGRSLAVAWNGAGTRIASVTADDGRVATYAYDGDGDLASVGLTDGGTTTYETDAEGRITKITDPDGVEVVANAYDSAGRVLSQTTPSGDTVTFSYDLIAGVTTVTPGGSDATTVYAHDAAGRLTSVTDAHGKVLTKSYDAAGNLVSVVDRRGATTTQTFDAHGNVTARSGPEGVDEGFTWDAKDRLVSHTNGEAETTTFSYEGDERVPSTVTDPEGATTSYDVAAGLVEETTDADGVVLDLTWDAERNLTGITDGAGGTTAYAYDAAGNRTTATTPLGHTTAWDFDGRRRVVGSTDAEGATRSWTWSAGGRLLTATDAEGHDTDYDWDDAGRPETVTDALGKVTTYAWDLDGNLTSVTRPGASIATATYDELGRRLSETDPTGVATTWTYDDDGNVDTVTDEAGKSLDYDWDLRGRLDQVTDRLGGVTDYTFDDADRLVSVLDPLAGTTSYAWDDAGRLVSRTVPDGGVWQQSWTPAGRLGSGTDPNGHTTDHDHDALGRLGTVTDPEGGVTAWAWDDDGRTTSVTSPEGLVTAYGWDDVGRLVSTTSPAGGVTTRTWTPRGRLATLTPPASGTRSFSYDALGRLTTATDANGEDTTWATTTGATR